MRRFSLFLTVVMICLGTLFFYQYRLKQNAANTEQMFEIVMAEKMRGLYDQAQDWSKPIQLNVHDDRLSGDYKLMSEFLLSYWMQNVEAMAATEDIDFQWQKANSGNSFNAHRIIHLAQSKGLGNEAKEAFFHAYMTEGLAIGEREVVEEIASRIGLDHAEVEDVLNSDELADFVRHDEKIAHEQLNVTGVPFFVFDQKLALSGAQPREIFLQALQQAQSASTEEIQQTDAAQCSDDQCEIKP